jgi:hypothetical protein
MDSIRRASASAAPLLAVGASLIAFSFLGQLGCGPAGGKAAANVATTVAANVLADIAAQAILQNGNQCPIQTQPYYPVPMGAMFMDPWPLVQSQSPMWSIDRATGLIVHANVLGGFNFHRQDRTLFAFSAWNNTTGTWDYFDSWGRRSDPAALMTAAGPTGVVGPARAIY